jgi:hypothetical protein
VVGAPDKYKLLSDDSDPVAEKYDTIIQRWHRTRHGHLKANAADAITLPECKDSSLFIFCSDVTIFLIVIDDKRKGR